MKLMRRLALVLFLTGCASAPPPDLVLVNGKVFTADASNPWAEALAVRGNRIAAVGSSDEIRALARATTRLIDLNGRVVVPGFNDAHYHSGIGPPRVRLELAGMDPSFDGVEQALARAVAAATPDQWITGTIGPAVLDDPRANRDTLDRFSARTPIMLTTWSGHGTILNTAALRILGIGDDERDPAGGFYLRDANGRITGVLHEYADYIARRRFAALADRETAVRTIRQDASAAMRLGITSIQEMATVMVAGQWADRIAEANVPIRWRLVRFPMVNAPGWFAAESGDRSTPRLRISGTKWIIDGTPVERLAHMRAPYKDRPDWRGALNFGESDLRRMLTESAREQVMLHVVGDRALDAVLAALEATGGSAFWRDKRVRIEHGDFLAPDQWERARSLGLIIVQNPSHFMIPEVMNARYETDRVARTQAVRSTLRAGIPLAIGSDGPVSPFLNLMFATIHANNPGEALAREEVVTAYTRGSAYAEFAEDEKGMLRRGMLADFAVLSADIFTIPPPQLPAVESVLTVIDGKVVYEAAP